MMDIMANIVFPGKNMAMSLNPSVWFYWQSLFFPEKDTQASSQTIKWLLAF